MFPSLTDGIVSASSPCSGRVIPVFSTVALLVAAILRLVLVFGRKKNN
jgi:hypothetical protein